MAEIIILGASNALPTLQAENSHFAVSVGERILLVDCGPNPLLTMERVGLEVHRLSDIILTHIHPDHMGGLPLFLMNLWLLGRTAPLTIHGLDYTLDRAERILDAFEWQTWPDFFPTRFHRLPEEEMTVLMDEDDLRVFASPVQHFLPNIGLRFEFLRENKTLAYSCDTEPCTAVIHLAHQADLLLHEATGPFRGHTSAAQAGEIASEAGARALYLIHYPTGRFSREDPSLQARQTFPGPVFLARDGMRITL